MIRTPITISALVLFALIACNPGTPSNNSLDVSTGQSANHNTNDKATGTKFTRIQQDWGSGGHEMAPTCW
jgi:hypothetical protein